MEVAKKKKDFCKQFFLLLTGLFFSVSALAQQGTVQGTVIDATGEPVIGANVVVKGTSNGSITDIDGRYTISNVESPSTLVFSFIGYTEQEVVYNGQPTINVTLREDLLTLDEVVVVGYGSLTRRELSSSIVQVDKNQFQQGGVGNPLDLISGKVAGLNVSNTSAADPNSLSSLQIRGASSVTASNEPLIVIDGIAGGNIRQLSPQDIESMTVLKDAASSAIYGTRGANGVVLITTKKGGSDTGRAQVTYDSWFGVNLAHSKPDILSPDEFRRSRRGTDYGSSTDWYDLLTRSFSYDTNHYLAISNNTANGYYAMSLNYKTATGIDIKSEREEYGGRFVTEQRMLDNRLQLGGTLNARRVNEIWGNNGMFDTALSMNPTMPVYNPDGSYYQPNSPTGARNPVAEVRDVDNNGQRLYVLATAEAKLNILQNDKQLLNTSLSYSLQYDDLKTNYYTPSTSGESFWGGFNGRARIEYQKWYTHRWEWLANYSLDINDHSFKAVAGYSYQESYWERVRAQNNDFLFDDLKWHAIGEGSYLGQGLAEMLSGKSLSKLIGVFGRVNYNWKNLLMASASIRHEGSTKFGPNRKWGTFPSVSLAWEIASMPFMSEHTDVVKSLKPRISYGETGRSDFDAYLSMLTYTAEGNYLMDGEWVNGYIPSAGEISGRRMNANPNLGWERSISINAGIDFVFWNRLRGSIDFYNRDSKDLLYTYTAPQPPFVYPYIMVNVGSTRNTGIEVAVDGDVFVNTPVTWTTGINYSYGTTKLTKLSSDVYQASYLELYQKPGVGTSEYFFRVQEGGKIGQFYGYEYAGEKDGQMMIYNNENVAVPVGEADASYKRYIGNGTPTSFLSWSNTLRYKNFDLNLFFRGAFGFDIFNMRKYGMGLKGAGTDNVLRSAYLENNNLSTGGGVISSYFLEKGDYFKLDNVTLGYNFNIKPNKFVDNLRLFVSAKNVFTITGYSGTDPAAIRVNGVEPGVDANDAYPTATQITVGVTLNFK